MAEVDLTVEVARVEVTATPATVDLVAATSTVEVAATPAVVVVQPTTPASVEVVTGSIPGPPGPAGEAGPPGAGIPEVFVDGAPAVLNFTPNGDGTYGIEVTL